MAHTASVSTAVDRLVDGVPAAPVLRAVACVFIATLTAAAAQVSAPLPFTVVPFTLQPTIVLLGGLLLGPRLGMASQVLYLAAGLAGLPVFAASASLPPGALRLVGPTGGYLLSYPIAALLVGFLGRRGFDRAYWTSFVAMTAGLLVIYVCGVAWLGLITASTSSSIGAGLQSAVEGGAYPFLVADLLKLVVAAAILPGFWRLIGAPESTDSRQA